MASPPPATPPRRTSRLLARALVAGSAALAACNDVDTGGRPEPFEVEGTTSTGTGPLAYPSGPYGVTRGQVIQDYVFSGYAAPEAARDLVELRLGDFFNPTGEEVFPEGSPFAGRPKPRAVGIVVGAIWCGPCQEEARNVLPDEHAELSPLGGELLFVLADANQPGVPANRDDLGRWIDTFDVPFPAVLDTSYVLGSVIRSDSYPANILIDTRDMTIAEVVAGIPPESYWATFEALARAD